MLRATGLCVVLLVVVGCAGGPAMPAPNPGAPAAAGIARLIFQRPWNDFAGGITPDVTVNELIVGSISNELSGAVDVPAGTTVAVVSGWGAPGRYVVRIPAAPGGQYEFRIGLRGGSFLPAAFGLTGALMDMNTGAEQSGVFTLALLAPTPPINAQPAPAPIAETAGNRE